MEEKIMQILILSDIHGNQQALQAVLRKVRKEYDIQACVLLGDLIDYGMHSNEVIQMINAMDFLILCNIWGNHEQAIWNGDYRRFSSERGKKSAAYTREHLSEASQVYLSEKMHRGGKYQFEWDGKKCLAVHGSLKDVFWGEIEQKEELAEYQNFDYVFSGHSHVPHFIEKFYDSDDSRRRNKKKVIFINPGSVGQPRNHNRMAQFAVLDVQTEKVVFDKADYDILREQKSFTGETDKFYRDRLEVGI